LVCFRELHAAKPAEYKIVADINPDMVSRNAHFCAGITPPSPHGDYSR
jgi:hypothetical protein